jgi:biopolymer transport protein ExbB/TolQ
VVDAFPGGSKGEPWTTALGCLVAAIPAVCFTVSLQQKVAKTVDAATSKMSDVITQIAGLG